jgi:hypothetical protein
MTTKSLERPIHMASQTFFLFQLSKMGLYQIHQGKSTSEWTIADYRSNPGDMFNQPFPPHPCLLPKRTSLCVLPGRNEGFVKDAILNPRSVAVRFSQ